MLLIALASNFSLALAEHCEYTDDGICLGINWPWVELEEIHGIDVFEVDEHNNTHLHHAINFNVDIEKIKFLLKEGANPNHVNNEGITPVHESAKRSNVDLMILLIEHGGEVSMPDKEGKTPLHIAAQYSSNPGIIKFLLLNGSDINKKTKYGDYPIHFAAYNPNPNVVDLFLSDAISIYRKRKTRFRLDSNIWLLNKMLREGNFAPPSGVNVNARGYNKNTPLHIATRFNTNQEVIKLLLRKGASLNLKNAWGDPTVHYAVKNSDDPNVIKTLLMWGADISQKNDRGSSPLHVAAAYNDDPRALDILLKYATDIDAKTDSGFTALHLAAKFNSNPDIVALLLKKGADINIKTKDGSPVLFLATINNVATVVDKLLEYGVDPNEKIEIYKGGTPLHMAAKYSKDPDVIKALLKNSADVNVRDANNETPLHKAAKYNDNSRVLYTFYFYDADMNLRDKDGNTPLHLSAIRKRNFNIDIILTLLNLGSDARVKNKLGQTVLDIGKDNNSFYEYGGYKTVYSFLKKEKLGP